MTRVIVHAGYHKTGTTSLQDFMAQNRGKLSDYARFFGKADFLDAGLHARVYGQKPYPWRLWRFRRSLRRFLDTLDPGGTIILSRETFSGGMPGHRRLYGALMMNYTGPAEKLAKVIISELRRRFGQDTDIVFFYTTRNKEEWIKSVHGHLLRSIRLTEDLQSFRQQFPDLLGPEVEAQNMAKTLAPIPVIISALEQADPQEGPACALLDLLQLPAQVRSSLTPAPRSNVGQPEKLREEFRCLNAAVTDRKALRQHKETLLHQGSK